MAFLASLFFRCHDLCEEIDEHGDEDRVDRGHVESDDRV